MFVVSKVLSATVRKFSTSAVRQNQTWQQAGIPGATLPFDVKNKFKLTVYFILYFNSGLTAPFLLLRSYLLKTYAPSSIPVKSTSIATVKPIFSEDDIDLEKGIAL